MRHKRTKSVDTSLDPPSGNTGGKYALYSRWAYNSGPEIDGSMTGGQLNYPQQIEFYDYTLTSPQPHRAEMGNDYSATPSANQTSMASALGNGPVLSGGVVTPATGLVASELMATLQGNTRGASPTSLSAVTQAGLAAWNTYVAYKLTHQLNVCP